MLKETYINNKNFKKIFNLETSINNIIPNSNNLLLINKIKNIHNFIKIKN